MPIPAVREVIFIPEFDSNEAISEGGVVILIVADDAVRLRRIRTLEENPGWGDDDVMTGNMPQCELKWLDTDRLGAQACKTIPNFFVWLAHLELH